MALAYVAPDCMQEVGLAQSGPSVDEQWVVSLGRTLGNGECSSVREAIGRANHEGIERILRVEATGCAGDGCLLGLHL
jgi:hypothetical protein